MVDLVLVHPPHPRSMPGLTIPTLETYLVSKGFSVVSLKAPKSHQDVIQLVQRVKPRFVAVSVPFTFYGPSAQQLVHMLKTMVDVPVVVGGAHVTIMPGEFTEADYICQGYGEKYLLNLLSGRPPVEGLDMDDLPFIYSPENTDLLPDGNSYYRYIGARGCVFNCSFCSNKLLSRGRVHQRDVRLVLDDLKQIQDHGYRYVVFNDETFTLNYDRVLSLCIGMVKQGIHLRWWCQTRANLLDEYLVQQMRQAGCVGISFGVESGDPQVLSDASKGVSLKEVDEAVAICKRNDVLVYGGFILGFPTDTPETVRHTIGYACGSGLDYAGFGVMMPFPGTRVRQQAEQQGGILSDDWSLYHVGNIVYTPPCLFAVDMSRLKWMAHGRFMVSSLHRLWLSWLFYCRQRGWRSKADFIRRLFFGLMSEVII